MLSRKGEKASEAMTAPRTSSFSSAAFRAAMPDRVDAAHLSGADAERGAVARQHDGVGLHELAPPPGEQQVGELPRPSGWRRVTTSGRRRRPAPYRAVCSQQSAGDAAVFELVARRRRGEIAGREHAHVGLGGESAQRLRRRWPVRPSPRRTGAPGWRRERRVELAVEAR